MEMFISVLKKYAVFSGRARRREYWMFSLFAFLIPLFLGFVDGATGMVSSQGLGLLSALVSLFFFVPSLAVAVRRLHDTNRSGWWLLINLLPLLGSIVFFVFMVLDSHPGENRFGPNPKGSSPD